MRSLAIAGFLALGVGVGGAFVVACSSDDNPAAPTGDAGDAGAPDVIEAGPQEAGLEQDPNVYPAQHQPIPVLTNPAKGPVLASPKVVTITFVGDAKRDAYRTFDATILTTDWWKAAIGGIGVNAGSASGNVELVPPWTVGAHATIEDEQLQVLLQQGISDGTLPAPQPGTIYALYFPKNITITTPTGDPNNPRSSSCSAFCGYHDSFVALVPSADAGVIEAGASDAGDGGDAATAPPTGDPVTTAYAVMATCDPGTCWSDDPFAQMTITGSHELAEASSDPYSGIGNSGYTLSTDDSWLNPDFYAAGSIIENGDACAGLFITEGKYTVQRIWSNAAAMKGEQPCQPVAAGSIYFAAAPRTTQISVQSPNRGVYKSYGYLPVKRGTTATAIVDVFSNAALQHDMLLYAGKVKRSQSDPSDLDVLNDSITLSLSRQSAHNGNAVILSVSVPDDASIQDFRMVVRAVYDMDYNDWPLIIHVK